MPGCGDRKGIRAFRHRRPGPPASPVRPPHASVAYIVEYRGSPKRLPCRSGVRSSGCRSFSGLLPALERIWIVRTLFLLAGSLVAAVPAAAQAQSATDLLGKAREAFEANRDKQRHWNWTTVQS